MKLQLSEFIKPVLRDRYVITLCSVIALIVLAVAGYIVASSHQTELQVVTHYTAFGVTNFYREKWYYLLSFAAFVVLIGIINISLVVKLYTQRGREFSIVFGWITVVVLLVTFAMARSILEVANLT